MAGGWLAHKNRGKAFKIKRNRAFTSFISNCCTGVLTPSAGPFTKTVLKRTIYFPVGKYCTYKYLPRFFYLVLSLLLPLFTTYSPLNILFLSFFFNMIVFVLHIALLPSHRHHSTPASTYLYSQSSCERWRKLACLSVSFCESDDDHDVCSLLHPFIHVCIKIHLYVLNPLRTSESFSEK